MLRDYQPVPLIERAPVFAQAILPGGSLLLARLPDSQAGAMARISADRIVRGDWPMLGVVKRRKW